LKKRGLILFLTLCVTVGFLQSCTVGRTDAAHLLECLLASQGSVPVGESYVLFASPDSDRYVDDALLSQLFGKGGTLPAALSLPRQGAFYLSVSCPFELMVFECDSRNDAKKVAMLCLERQNTLCSFWQRATEESLPPSGVTVQGCWVLSYLCPQQKACLDTFKRNV
jgi:hypothetical protein